jgi:hypothetical protein
MQEVDKIHDGGEVKTGWPCVNEYDFAGSVKTWPFMSEGEPAGWPT